MNKLELLAIVAVAVAACYHSQLTTGPRLQTTSWIFLSNSYGIYLFVFQADLSLSCV